MQLCRGGWSSVGLTHSPTLNTRSTLTLILAAQGAQAQPRYGSVYSTAAHWYIASPTPILRLKQPAVLLNALFVLIE